MDSFVSSLLDLLFILCAVVLFGVVATFVGLLFLIVGLAATAPMWLPAWALIALIF